jgi:hypothetical protein
MIDLIGDQLDAHALRCVDELAQRIGCHHGAGRIGRAGNQYATKRRIAMRCDQHLGCDRPARRLRGLDRHRLAAEGAQNMTIGRIAWQRDRHAIPGLEQREEGEHKSGR